jgi:hypothetical protein
MPPRHHGMTGCYAVAAARLTTCWVSLWQLDSIRANLMHHLPPDSIGVRTTGLDSVIVSLQVLGVPILAQSTWASNLLAALAAVLSASARHTCCMHVESYCTRPCITGACVHQGMLLPKDYG